MNTTLKVMLLSTTLVLATFVPATRAATEAEAASEARIHFISHGGIRDWDADGDRALYVQDQRRRWYHVQLMIPCFDLPHVLTIGVETHSTDTFDKWSAIIVKGERYQVQSVTDTGLRGNKSPRRRDEEKQE